MQTGYYQISEELKHDIFLKNSMCLIQETLISDCIAVSGNKSLSFDTLKYPKTCFLMFCNAYFL